MPISGGGGTGGGGGVGSDVNVLSLIPGTAATRLGKAEDAVHASGDVGVMSLAVRADTGASLAGNDGDYAPLQVDSAGALRVTGGGGGTQYTVNAAAPADPTGTASLLERDDALSALSEAEGDWTNMRANANGALWTAVNGTVTVDGSGVTQPVSGTVAVTGVATAANQATAIGHLDGVEGLLTTIDADTSNLSVVGGGTEAAAIRVTIANDSTGVLSVDDNGASLTVDGTVAATQSGTWTLGANSGVDVGDVTVNNAAGASAVNIQDGGNSITVDGTVTANLAAGTNNIGDVDIASGTLTTLTTLTGGGVAHDAADSGNPHKVGGRARTSDVTAVANDDRVDQIHDALGAQVVRPYALHENLVSGATAAITSTTSTSVIAAGGAGVRNYVTSLLVTNSHATVGTLVTITDGSGGATLYAGYAAPAGGGFSVSLPTPLRLTANTALHAVCGTTGANVYVSASGYRAAV